MSFTINSNIFKIQNTEHINQFVNFLKLNGEFTKGQFHFEDQEQGKKFNVFRQAFQTLQENFPHFQLKFKSPQDNLQSHTDIDLKLKSEDTRQTIQTRTNDQTISIDQYRTFDNQQPYKQAQQEVKNIQQYNEYTLDDSLRIQESSDSIDEYCDESQLDSNPKQINSFKQEANDQEDIEFTSELKSEFLKQLSNQESKCLLFNSEVAKQEGVDTEIKILGLNSSQIIKLQNNFILTIIEKFFLQEWNLLIKSLNLEQKRINLYKFQLIQDFEQVQKGIQEFINKIQYVDIEFCYYTNYTMTAQSKINEYLRIYEVYPFQFQDYFYLVSKTQTLSELQEISQQINNNYRGIYLHFSTLRPYKQESLQNNDLSYCRFLYYEKYLVEQFKQFCMNQYYDEQYFFLEMNFSHVKQNRELFEKQIKKYIQCCLKTPLLLKFSTQCNQTAEKIIDTLFQEQLEAKQFNFIYLRKDGQYLIFGNTQDLQNVLTKISQNQETKQTQIAQTTIYIDKQNLIQPFYDQFKPFDLVSLIQILSEIEFENQQHLGSDLKLRNTGKINFYYLLQTLRTICSMRQQNQNKEKIQSIYSKFTQNPYKAQLNKLDNELFSLSQVGCQKGKNEKLQSSINVVSNNIKSFSHSKIIELKPKFLDGIINDYFYQDFQEKLVEKNNQIQFIKIEEGKYQLSCQSIQVIKQFEDFFSKFVTQKFVINEELQRVFEFSTIKKQEFSKKGVYYILESDGLNFISRSMESIHNVIQSLQNYRGFILTMHNLKYQNLDEKPENYQLVQARVGYIKYIFGDFLKNTNHQNKQISNVEIEFKEEQEISAFTIFHLYFDSQRYNLNSLLMEQTTIQFQEEIISMIQNLYFFEIKADQETGKIIFSNIIKNPQIYITFKQQYIDYFITILGNQKQFKELYDNLIKLQINEKQQQNIEFSIYIDQFCIFQNIVQFAQSKKKLKQDFEKKGFEVDDQKIKWLIKSKKPAQAFQILSILVSKMIEEDDRIFQDSNDKNDNLISNISSIRNEHSSIQNKSSISSYQDFLEDWSSKSFINNIYQGEIIKRLDQIATNKNDINQPYKQQQQQPFYLLQNEDFNKQNIIVQQQQQQQQQLLLLQSQQSANSLKQENLQKNKSFNDNLDGPNNNSQFSISEISDPNKSTYQFQSETQQTFDKKCLLVEFQKSQIQVLPPSDEKLIQYLTQSFKNEKFEYFEPKVDQDYINYFNKIAQQTITLYIIQKPDKEYHNEFSKKLLYYLNYEVLIEKFMSHQSLIIICCKANKAARYQIPNKDKSYQICLKDPNQVLPYLWIRRKTTGS